MNTKSKILAVMIGVLLSLIMISADLARAQSGPQPTAAQIKKAIHIIIAKDFNDPDSVKDMSRPTIRPFNFGRYGWGWVVEFTCRAKNQYGGYANDPHLVSMVNGAIYDENPNQALGPIGSYK